MRTVPFRRALLLLTGAALGAPTLPGQSLVTGVVRDTVSGRIFAGAAIELVPASAPWLSGFKARSDSVGRYTIPDVAAGRYIVGFLHPDLDSVGLSQVSRPLDVRAGKRRVSVDLSPPGGMALIALLCGPAAGGDGAVLGRVRAASDGRGVQRGRVTVQWALPNIDATGLRTDRVERVTQVADDGRFLACGVPTGVPIVVQAHAGDTGHGSSSGAVRLEVPEEAALLHRDLLVADARADSSSRPMPADWSATTPLRGTARIAGRVITVNDAPHAGARIIVPDAQLEVLTDSSGTFQLAGLPPGTRTVELVTIGFVPQRQVIDLRPGRDAVVRFHPLDRVQELDVLTVRAKRDLTGFHRRKRTSTGTFLTAEDIARKNAYSVGEALVGVNGLRYTGIDPQTLKPAIGGRFNCSASFFLDGVSVALADIDGMLGVRQIGGIEVYTNAWEAPPLLTTGARFLGPDGRDRGAPNLNSGCSTVVVWTKSYVP
ncbi:MAG: carboxypeptidase regulatory-like domain-containing protein [Gemmatimonadaceae bacterium]|nr:carboxypeptidase regulatory-like domain-containing protein [Gemmatimonadaceae bacterium]